MPSLCTIWSQEYRITLNWLDLKEVPRRRRTSLARIVYDGSPSPLSRLMGKEERGSEPAPPEARSGKNNFPVVC